MIVGVDEAGRGPLAGPVVAAAVVLCGKPIRGLGDSKMLSEPVRAKLDARIRERCAVAVGVASVGEIDSLNIFHATMLAMTRAVRALADQAGEPVEVLVDGNLTPAGRNPAWRWPARPIVGGDARERAIMAASIVAKQHRDRIMTALCSQYPDYGFSRHKGYATPEHRDALARLGPSPVHRMSFAPCRPGLAQGALFSQHATC